MAAFAPPDAPIRTATGDQDDPRRFRMRMTQVIATMVTLLITAWLCTLGVFTAIIALSIAKHILVAVLMMGTGVDAPQHKH